MKTKNIYSYPIERSYIQKIISSEAPAHRKYQGKLQNSEYDLTNAIDFLCEIGTPVMAALEGKVVDAKDGLTKNWDKFEAPPESFMSESEQDGNFVVIKHDNEELSIYSHLKPGEIRVKLGDYVKAGEVIGYSGHNGWSIKPHLHFVVFRFTKPEPSRDLESLEIRWK